MDWLNAVGPVLFVVALVIGAVSIGKIKASEAWKEIAAARKEEIDVRDAKINSQADKIEARDDQIRELTASHALLQAEIEKLKGLPNLTVLLDALKEFRRVDEARYQDMVNKMSLMLDERFALFAEKINGYHEAEISKLNEIATLRGAA